MHQSPQSASRPSRRDVLRMGLTAAAVAGLGSACSGGPATSAAGGDFRTPTYIPAKAFDGVLRSKVPGVPLAYRHYPRPPVATVAKAPGTGGKVTGYTMTWGGQPTPIGHNDYWQGLNMRLGTQYLPTVSSADGYEQKLATLLAGGDLPDVTVLRPCAAVNTALRQQAFANLNDVLGGDGIKKYPNIAWTRPEQWKQVLVDGALYGVPIDVPVCNQQIRIRQDWVKKLGFDAAPRNADEFHAFMTAVSRSNVAGHKAYGLATYGGGSPAGGNTFVNQLFKVPNQWRLEGGKLTHMFETEEFAQALQFSVKLWKDGAFHPDALSLSQNIEKELSLFTGNQSAILSISIMGWYQHPYVDTVEAADGQILPYLVPGSDGKGGTYYLGGSVYGLCGISAAAAKDDKRLEEILGVINYLKAPWGSTEATYMGFGQQGRYWNWKDGAPTERDPDKDGPDFTGLVYGFRPSVWWVPGNPKAADDCLAYGETAVRNGVPNPCDGIASKVADRVNPVLSELADNHLNQIVAGHRPMSDLRTFLSQWRERGGDDMRKDLLKQLKARGNG